MRTWAVVAMCAWATAAVPAGQPVILGQTLPLSGPMAHVGQALQSGRQACVDWVNARAPLPGRTLRLVTRDDAGSPRQAVDNAGQLAVGEQAVALLGAAGTATGQALARWAGAEQMAVVGPFGGEVASRVDSGDNVFYVTASQSQEAERLAQHLVSLGIGRVAIVRSMDAIGQSALLAMEEGLGAAGVAPVAVIAARPDGADAAQAVAQAYKAGAQAVALATAGRATSAMLRALAAARDVPRISHVYSLSSAASLADLAEAGATGQGFTMTQVLPSPKDSRLALAARFRQALPAAVSRAMHIELEGCLSVLAVAEVLRRKPADTSREGVLRALRSAGTVSLGGYDVDLGDRMRGARFTDIVYIGPDGRVIR